MKLNNLAQLAKFRYEYELWNSGINTIAGIDEVGRGPIAGPLVTACVVFTSRKINSLLQNAEDIEFIKQIDDSKKLSEKKRETLNTFIKQKADKYAIFSFDSNSIDEQGVGMINELALAKAAKYSNADHVLVDHFKLKGFENTTSITKGDSKSFVIACASIIAKVYRDNLMCEYAKKYPEYGFDKHKGYGTKQHINAISLNDYCPIHRKSFSIKF